MNSGLRIVVAGLWSLALVVIVGRTSGQSASVNWRQTPVDLAQQQDPLTPKARAERSIFCNLLRPIPNGTGLNWGGGVGLGSPSEIELYSNCVAIVATFESYRTFLSENGLAAYTEVTLRVSRVLGLRGPDLPSVQNGSSVEIAIPGGSVRRNDGSVFSLPVKLDYPIQPHHAYILCLSWAEHFTYFHIYRQWDVTSGKAVPEDALTKRLEEKGKSQIANMTASDAIVRAQSLLVASHSDSR